MINLGLSAADKRTLHQTLRSDHRMRIRVEALTLDGEHDADLSDKVLDGQVDIDWAADVTRSASLTLIDTGGGLDFDSDSPAEAALFLDRMISIHYRVLCPLAAGLTWVDIPIFRGPVTELSRTGHEISVTAMGKETLCMGAVFRPLTLKKNTSAVRAIRTILAERAGEKAFDLPELKTRLPKAITLGRESVPWTAARSIARSLGNRQLFYDGAGRVRLRRRPARPVYSFTTADMVSDLQISYTSQEQTVNTVFVKGGVPDSKKPKGQLTAEVFPQRNHPLSPWRLGRTNAAGDLVPRYLLEVVEDKSIRTVAKARAVGREHLQHGMAQAIEASFDAMPVPMLEPGDLVRAVTDGGAVTFRLHQFSIPLTAGNPMTLGYNRNVSPKRRHGTHRGALRAHVHPHWAPPPAKKTAAKKAPARKAPAKKAAAR